MIFDKISIGTAQFGNDYGITNQSGKVQKTEVFEILSSAKKNNIVSIDTAMNYGESEAILGEYGIESFEITTKLPAIKRSDQADVEVKKSVNRSLERLSLDKLPCLLLHSTEQLFHDSGNTIWNALVDLKSEGKISRIGYSIYDPKELDLLFHRYKPDAIQVPVNIFDQRLLKNGWAKKLKHNNVEIQARSVFLQGILLLEAHDRPEEFTKWKDLWDEWDNKVAQSKSSRLKICLDFVLKCSYLDKIILGLDSLSHLNEILLELKNPSVSDIHMDVNDEKLLNPLEWQYYEFLKK